MYSRGEYVKLVKNLKKSPLRPIILAKGMIWYNVKLSKICIWKMPTIWDTLLYIGYLEEIWQGGGMVAQNAKTKDYIYWSKNIK